MSGIVLKMTIDERKELDNQIATLEEENRRLKIVNEYLQAENYDLHHMFSQLFDSYNEKCTEDSDRLQTIEDLKERMPCQTVTRS